MSDKDDEREDAPEEENADEREPADGDAADERADDASEHDAGDEPSESDDDESDDESDSNESDDDESDESDPDATDDAPVEAAPEPKKKKKAKKGKKSKRAKKRAAADDEASDEPNADADPPSSDEPAADDDDDELDARPAPLRAHRVLGGVLFGLGGIATFLLMANVDQVPHGALVGLFTLATCVFGLLQLTGLLRPAREDAIDWRDTALGQLEGEPAWCRPAVTVPIALAILLVGGLAGGYAQLPKVIVVALCALFPSAVRRPGMLVFTLVGLMYLPLLGTFSLWDPWETHYGEVAREILSRDDWISTWWAQENWFWSKPILIFWTEALSMSAWGMDFHPDANPLYPEWAVRTPVCAFAICAVMVVYGSIKRIFGTRAGALSALVLATAPHYFFLSHQAITDMFLVSNLVMAMCMLALAFAEDPNARVREVRIFGRGFSAHTAAIGGLLMLALPQALYLITRNLEFHSGFGDGGFGFAVHADEMMYGSAGNTGVPGNPEVRMQPPFLDVAWAQPWVQGVLWLVVLGAAVWLLRHTRRIQRLQMTAFYVFCALAFMGKGIPGLALPGLIALLYLVASRRWNVLADGQLRVGPGILVASCVGLPWYVAMFARHGAGFTDRLLIHDHINRLAQGVHGDTGSIQYFLWQLGYATFPWVALIPAAVLSWLWMRDRGVKVGTQRTGSGPYRSGDTGTLLISERERRVQTTMLIGIWFFASFALFSAMITKFHHYIFPAVPPAAILVGVTLDRFWGKLTDDVRQERVATVVAVLSALPLVAGIGGLWGNLRGLIPEEVPVPERGDWVLDHGMGAGLSYGLIFVGAAAFAWAARTLWRAQRPSTQPSMIARREDLSLSVAVGAGAMLAAFVGRDLSWVTSARPQGYERLIHLFVYNYGRPWPDHFDYRPVLTGFAIVAGLLLALMVVRVTRAAAARAIVGMALCFGGWVLNLYMVDLAPHWGMKEIFGIYYERRTGPEEPVIAWQMNWKGENFYTGNRVFAFVDLDNEKIREWLGEHEGESAYFCMEPSRLGSFRNLVRGREVVEVTDRRLNNKFMIVHVPRL